MPDDFRSVMGTGRGRPDDLAAMHPTPHGWERVEALTREVPDGKPWLRAVTPALRELKEHAHLIDRAPLPTALCDRLAAQIADRFGRSLAEYSVRALRELRISGEPADRALLDAPQLSWADRVLQLTRAHLKASFDELAEPERYARAVRHWELTGGLNGPVMHPSQSLPSALALGKRPVELATRLRAVELLAGREHEYVAAHLGVPQAAVSDSQASMVASVDFWKAPQLLVGFLGPHRYEHMRDCVTARLTGVEIPELQAALS